MVYTFVLRTRKWPQNYSGILTRQLNRIRSFIPKSKIINSSSRAAIGSTVENHRCAIREYKAMRVHTHGVSEARRFGA